MDTFTFYNPVWPFFVGPFKFRNNCKLADRKTIPSVCCDTALMTLKSGMQLSFEEFEGQQPSFWTFGELASARYRPSCCNMDPMKVDLQRLIWFQSVTISRWRFPVSRGGSLMVAERWLICPLKKIKYRYLNFSF